MQKILIIGQAPPAVKQEIPYDSTMLYEILEWVGISKEKAQDIFEFEAVYDKFPGYSAQNQHLKPSLMQMVMHWNRVLETKVQLADKVILLGNVARDFFNTRPKTWSCSLEVLELIHPSRLNFNRIMKDKEKIISKLQKFLEDVL